jgi:hypothetical protein
MAPNGTERPVDYAALAAQLATVAEVAAAVGRQLDLPAIARTLRREARWLLSFDRLALAVVAPDGLTYRLVDEPAAIDVPVMVGLAGRAIARRAPLLVADGAAGEGATDPALAPDARSALVLPLVVDGAIRAVLVLSSRRPGAYAPEGLAIAHLLALQVAASVKNALLVAALDDAEATITALALTIEAKDPYTEGHCQRLAVYAERLGRDLGLPPDRLDVLRKAGILHDVGKIAVPEGILGKPGPLTDEEFAILKVHPVVGERICRPLRSVGALLPAIRGHHERCDGRGYPDGLAGEAIPLEARIMAIVDAYDAMTSDRPYRRGMEAARALAILAENRGPQWDPELVARFVRLMERPAASAA